LFKKRFVYEIMGSMGIIFDAMRQDVRCVWDIGCFRTEISYICRMGPIVYIVDDNFVSEFATRIILEQSLIPCKVLSFTDADLALSSFLGCVEKKKNVPDIILLDLNMPVVDGWGFLEKIGAIDYPKDGTAIFMVSTFANASVRKRSLNHPLVKGYFERPLSIANIRRILAVEA